MGPGFDPLATHNMEIALRGVGAFFVLKILLPKTALSVYQLIERFLRLFSRIFHDKINYRYFEGEFNEANLLLS